MKHATDSIKHETPNSKDGFHVSGFMFQDREGQTALEVLVVGAIAIVLISGFGLWAFSALKLSLRDYSRALAFSASESGIEYYRWHLAHNHSDYTDGTGHAGPYIHTYYDKDGTAIGQFTLDITPPPVGSTIVKVRSTGTVFTDPSVKKIIEAKLGIPSWAKYSAAANSFLWFGSSEEIFGEVYSNKGVRVDGLAHNKISSALATTTDFGVTGNPVYYGVYTKKAPADPSPPTYPVLNRPDVFVAGRSFPGPALDFTGLTSNLANLKSQAKSGGLYFGSSTASGYHVTLKSNGSFDLYKVTALTSAPGGCTNSQGETGWGTWSVKTQTFLKNYAYPTGTNVIFLEDNAWVDGTSSVRLTIASGRFPEVPATNSDIIVNGNLTYTAYDGTVSVGLIGQGNVRIGLNSSDTIEIDAAMIAKNKGTIRNYYSSSCGTGYLRAKAIFRGMQATNSQGYFAWGNSGGAIISGYQIQQTVYDPNLLYAPPPSFPLTSDQYSVVSWAEVQ